jgi:adenylate kinase family enzyme
LVTGASGAGTTTLAREISGAWSVPHADVDDYFWMPTVPPYTTKRPVEDRLRLMTDLFLPRDAWVMSGSVMGWGDPLLDRIDAVVFIFLDAATRLRRLEQREAGRYGSSNAAEDWNGSAHAAFMEWARRYDDPDFSGRSRVRHERWLAALVSPVLHLDAAQPVPGLMDAIEAWTPGPDSADPHNGGIHRGRTPT